MDKPYLELSYFQVVLAALLILINGAVSVLLKLDLERRLLLPRSARCSASADRAGARVGLPDGPLVGRADDDGAS